MKTDKLKKLNACIDAREWVAAQRNYKKAWQNCERGDWMLWLAKKLKVNDRKLTLAKFKCANQVRHLMKDQRSIAALDAAERYGNGEICRDELDDAAYAAYAAAYTATAAAAYTAAADAATAAAAYTAAADAATAAAAYTAAAAAAAADAAAAYAVYAVYAAADDADDAGYAGYAAYAATAAARKESLKKSADICRKILTEEVLIAYKKLKS